MKSEEYKKRFLQIFDSMAGKHSRWEIWQDFVQMTAISISNAVDRRNAPKREEAYRHIAAKYSSAELEKFATLFGEVITCLEEDPEQDLLGELYMMCQMGSARAGQFFTPYHISALLTQLTDENLQDPMPGGFITVSEPSCGGGASIIAYINACRKRGCCYQDKVLVVAQDIDMIVGLMCYIQISLLGCAGYVVIGDTLRDPAVQLDRRGLIPAGPRDRIWYTPVFMTGIWVTRRKIAEMEVAESNGKQRAGRKLTGPDHDDTDEAKPAGD